MKDYILSFTLLASTLLAYSTLVLALNKTTLRSHHSPPATATTWESDRDPQSFEPVSTDSDVSAPQRATR